MHQGVDGETDAGIGEVDDGVDALLVDPPARDRDADVGLVLMIGGNDFDAEAARLFGEILGRQLRADQRALADLVGERTGEVAEHADLDLAAGNLRNRGRRRAGKRRAEKGEGNERPETRCGHGVPPDIDAVWRQPAVPSRWTTAGWPPAQALAPLTTPP